MFFVRLVQIAKFRGFIILEDAADLVKPLWFCLVYLFNLEIWLICKCCETCHEENKIYNVFVKLIKKFQLFKKSR